jgi:hypothetical protein
MVGFCEHGDEPSGSIKAGNTLNHKLFKDDPVLWSCLSINYHNNFASCFVWVFLISI